MEGPQSSALGSMVKEEFGEASAEELAQVLRRNEAAVEGLHSGRFGLEMLPQGGGCLVAGAHVMGREMAMGRESRDLMRANLQALARSLMMGVAAINQFARSAGGGPALQPQGLGERLLQVPEKYLRLLAPPHSSDTAALRLLAEAVHTDMSAAEVGRVLREEGQGQQFMHTLSTSPTFGAVVCFASTWWGEEEDLICRWLTHAEEWVLLTARAYGRTCALLAKSVVDQVLSRHEVPTKVMENIPYVGLVVAWLYWEADHHSDQALVAFAKNVNAIVTLMCAAVLFCVGGPTGAMLGSGLGKAAGLLLQKAIARAIEDPELRAEVGDISATRFFVEVGLAGASGGVSQISQILAAQLALDAFKKIAMSQSLVYLLVGIPKHFALKDIEEAEDAENGKELTTKTSLKEEAEDAENGKELTTQTTLKELKS